MKCPKCQTDNPDDSKFCKECAASLTLVKDVSFTVTLKAPNSEPLKGSIVGGKYEIIQEIGRGGMGIVYEARDKSLKRTVALKFLPYELTQDQAAKQRFIQEAQAAAALNHANICTVYEVDQTDGKTFISMEYIDGETLKDRLASGPLDIDAAIDFATQVAQGLGKAHGKGIIHRDIKPANIMINDDGNAKIMDFGLAKLSWGMDLTQTSAFMGTVAYMSPEQARGETVDLRTDIWSLGAMLFEMLTGEKPYFKDQAQALVFSILNDRPKAVTSLRPEVPGHLVSVINRALEKDPSERYASIEEFIADLQRSFSASEAESAQSIAVLPFKNMSADPEQEYFCDGLSEELINALTQIKELRVVARTSAFSFKNTDRDIRDIGRQLSVETILEGSVRKSGTRLRITAQLIKVADGYHLWSERYDRELDDVFEIQDEISLTIAEKLKLSLLDEHRDQLVKRTTRDVGSYNTYLRALYLRRRLNLDDLLQSIELFKQAIEEDPDNALAWAGIAYAHMVSFFYGGAPFQEAYMRAVQAVTRALELDENLVEAYEARCAISSYLEWDWESGKRYIEKAVELNPGYPWGYFHLATYYVFSDKIEKSFPIFGKAIQLDPLNPAFHRNLGVAKLYQGDVEGAVECFLRVAEMDTNFPALHYYFGMAYMQMSKYEEALHELQLEELYSKANVSALSGIVYVRMGKKDKALQILDKYTELYVETEQSQVADVPYYGLAALCFALENIDLGFEWLERAYDTHDSYLHNLRIDFLFDDVRSDPRYVSLLQRMNLSD